jgi:hypothetical protein
MWHQDSGGVGGALSVGSGTARQRDRSAKRRRFRFMDGWMGWIAEDSDCFMRLLCLFCFKNVQKWSSILWGKAFFSHATLQRIVKDLLLFPFLSFEGASGCYKWHSYNFNVLLPIAMT